MKIGIDGNEANVRERVGVSVYTYKFLVYCASQASEKQEFVIYLRQSPLPDMPSAQPHFQYKVIKGPCAWSQFFLPVHLYLHRSIDVFFSPAHYTPRFCPVPVVVTIHDLAHLLYPQELLPRDRYKLTHWTAYAVHQAKSIIAVSKNTKKDIVEQYHIPAEKITIIYNGFEKEVTHQVPVKGVHANQYILYAGTLQPRKNLEVLIQAFHILIQKNNKLQLVLAGKKGWLYEPLLKQIKSLHLEQNVILTDYIPNNELAWLYAHAICLVHPSLYEGFGITLLEAMSFHCPVISSFRSSLPEIGGEACLYVDPTKPEDIVTKVLELEHNANLRKETVQKGDERIKQFSWDTCVKKTLEVIEQTIA